MPGKIIVRNYTTLTDYAALLRAGIYLGGKHGDAEEGGFRFRVTENGGHGVVVKITEVESGKKPTAKQKFFLGENGFDPEKWRIIKDTPEKTVIDRRIVLQKKTETPKQAER